MLEIKKLNSGYGKMQVLWGVDLSVEPQQIVSIIGPNGSGKSTVLKSIYGITDFYSGEIIFKGNDIAGKKTSEIISLGIGYAPQGKLIFNNMTVQENIEMGGFSIYKKDELKNKIEEIFLEFPMLKAKKDKIAHSLSGGEKQQISFARALITNPDLLILDEPTLGLSPIVGKQILNILIDIKNRKKIAIIIVEQNARQAVEISDKTYVLEDGKVALVGGKELLKNQKIKKIYFGG
ncbi:MAG: ABC transporter ATP-binding protein [Parcubacteria group bacterium]|jgi:ABC-type branched-subunit amino acid transport system ATPase component